MSAEGYPRKQPTEEELLQVILQSSTSTGSKSDFRLLPALDELGRMRIANRASACGILLEAAQGRQSSLPESELFSKLLSDLCNEDDECLMMLAVKLPSPRVNAGVVALLPKVIAGLNAEKQDKLVLPLVQLVDRTIGDLESAKVAVDCLSAVSSESARQDLARRIEAYSGSGNPAEVLSFAMAASRVSRKENLASLLSILDKSSRGWYSPHSAEIQNEICRYLQANPDERAAPALLTILRQGYRPEIAKAIVAISNKSVVDKLLDLIETMLLEQSRDTNNSAYVVAQNATRILSEIDPTHVDLKRLLSMHKLLGSGDSDYHISQVVIKLGKPALPLIFELLKRPERNCYSFAVGCLNQMGVALGDMTAAFDPPPMVQLVNFFFKGATPVKLWQNKEDLGSTLYRVDLRRFEVLVQNLLNGFNFVTIYVDKSGKSGVDVVGIAPAGLKLVVAGVTSGFPKDDLQKLQATVDEMWASMPSLLSRYEILPVLFTKTDNIYPADSTFAREHGIIILTSNDVEHLLEMSLTGRTAQDLMQFLADKRFTLRNQF